MAMDIKKIARYLYRHSGKFYILRYSIQIREGLPPEIPDRTMK